MKIILLLLKYINFHLYFWWYKKYFVPLWAEILCTYKILSFKDSFLKSLHIFYISKLDLRLFICVLRDFYA